MNPIYIEHDKHVSSDCDCYKIDLPWTEPGKYTKVLCTVEDGYEKAKILAATALTRHFMEALTQEPCRR